MKGLYGTTAWHRDECLQVACPSALFHEFTFAKTQECSLLKCVLACLQIPPWVSGPGQLHSGPHPVCQVPAGIPREEEQAGSG